MRPVRSRVARRASAGWTLLDAIVAMGVIGGLLTVGIPRLDRLTRAARLDAAAHEVAAALRWARQEARKRGHKVGLKFDPKAAGGRPTYTLYADGDQDGVRSADIRSGIDPSVSITRRLELGADIRFGIPLDSRGRAPRAPFSRQRLDRPEDPIRFNRSDIASFAAVGSATPGTVYLTNGTGLIAVRVRNRVGKVDILRYDPKEEVWR